MVQNIIKIALFVSLLLSYSLGRNYNSEDIIDVVDYKITKVQKNVNYDLVKVKSELKKVEKGSIVSDEILSQLNGSIATLEKNIDSSNGEIEAIKEQVIQYKSMIQANNDKQAYILGFIVVTFIISFLLVQNYISRIKEELSKENKSSVEDETIYENITIDEIESKILNVSKSKKAAEQIKKMFESLREKYQNIEASEVLVLKEIRNLIQEIKEKKTRKKVYNYIQAIS